MRKAYCDMCGKELRPGAIWSIVHFDPKDSTKDSTIDLCGDCLVAGVWSYHLGEEADDDNP